MRARWAIGMVGLLGVVAATSVTAAIAQSADDPAPETDPVALLERLDELEDDLPGEVAPADVELSDATTWANFEGDADGTATTLAALDDELRSLYVDADDAEGPVAEAITLVARGWLDVAEGSDALEQWESNDLAFPMEGEDDDEVATGADELRGQAEVGIDQILLGRARQLAGYTALRELDEAEPETQEQLDLRADEAEDYDAEVRPDLARALSDPTTEVLVPQERFGSDAPGMEARARSMEVVCVDRESLQEEGGVATDEVVDELAPVTPERADCPDLPDGVEARD